MICRKNNVKHMIEVRTIIVKFIGWCTSIFNEYHK